MSQISVLRNSQPTVQLYCCQTSFALCKFRDFYRIMEVYQLLISCWPTDFICYIYFFLYFQILENKVSNQLWGGPFYSDAKNDEEMHSKMKDSILKPPKSNEWCNNEASLILHWWFAHFQNVSENFAAEKHNDIT